TKPDADRDSSSFLEASSRAHSGFSTMNTMATSAAAPSTENSTSSPLPLPVRANTAARKIQTQASSITAAPSASRPGVLRVNALSFRIRASTGNAVTEIAAAMNSANGQKPTPSGAKAG